eukprot:TRINITY_DN59060_c0_g1_i1.p1 TRINITY_DN59060_c0_g1~~TRINITY_DN59060_c0_g1_i1.p1  ORF type:complete len:457 (+),score=121.41 TRINITY_DN59060_c0_g1_i1:80-1450(+)
MERLLLLSLRARSRLASHCVLLLSLLGSCLADVEYYGVCDAGSTGTRLYIFALDTAAGGSAKASSIFVKKTKPGLSSYKDAPEKAAAPLLKLFQEGAEKVPADRRASMPLAIFGTAGMRLLEKPVQDKIWSAVRHGLTADQKAYPFDAATLQTQTISGDMEGLWAVLTTNFLTGRISHDLALSGKASPVGLMDLGGSSTQIGMPKVDTAKAGVLLNGDDTTVHSYLGFGMTHIREQMRKNTAGGEDAACYMKGAVVEDQLAGAGAASQCRALIHKMMTDESKSCKVRREGLDSPPRCLGDIAEEPGKKDAIAKGTLPFYAVAGFTYVVDFVRWWVELQKASLEDPSLKEAVDAAIPFLSSFPNPTLEEFEAAVNAMCAGQYSLASMVKHPYTGEDNAPYRCFQANYILVLLKDVYGFSQSGRSITFALDIDGEDLEWPLGAVLYKRWYSKGNKQEL